MKEIIVHNKYNSMLNIENKHFIKCFLEIKNSKSKYTALSYERDIKDFFKVENLEEISLERIRSINIFHVEKYILELQSLGFSSATINRKISAMSALYNWLLKYQDPYNDIRIIKFNPFANVREEKPTINNKSTEFLTEEEAKKLLAAIDTTTILGKRNKALLALAFTTALRKSEMINIRLCDIKEYDKYQVIEVKRKGNKKDMVKLQPKVKELIDEYVLDSGRNYEENYDEYLFIGHGPNNNIKGKRLDPSTLNYMLNKISKEAGINKHLKVHSTRHSAITIAITQGATIEKVREFAAHKSIATTNRYVHSIDKLRDNPGDNIDIF